jgi:2-haloacid dehalogenase
MPFTLAFDIYGTLIDTAGITENLKRLVGDQAGLFSARWREKQLEYSFRRGLMEAYQDFSSCTRDALNYTCDSLDLTIEEADKATLLAAYRTLPAFTEVTTALDQLKAAGHRLFAFSNGLPDDLEALLNAAAIRDYFLDIVSVHEIGTFKPNPAVYRHFLQRAQSQAASSWLISGNPFDVLGAQACGMQTAWVRRSASTPFDPWGPQPTVTVPSLAQLADELALQ